VVMASGPLSGTFVPAAGKLSFAAKSPATGGWGETNIGGHLAAEIKYAGYDALVLEGVAARPSYIFIRNDTVEVRDANHLWGKGALEAERALKDELGEEFQVATIGQAGENLVVFACISHDFGRQAGRTGLGAVLGSKNVKAIAIRGTGAVPIADPERALSIGKEMYRASFDALGVCRLLWVEIDFDLAWYPRVLETVTGQSYSWDDLNRVAERTWNLTRLFWIKHLPGFGRKDDYPPARFMEEPIPDGPTAGRLVARDQFDWLLDDYYALRGWDANGHPTPHKLAELGLLP
jgi:aldehyde:ferredoxin oxidoreductase